MSDVYFLRPVGMPDAPIKIGYSSDIEMRLRIVGGLSPFPLEVLYIGFGGRKVENKLHWAFADERTHFEWFRSSPRLLKLIEDAKRDGLQSAMSVAGIPWPYDNSVRAA
jgi:hypothetical protein